MFCGVIQPCQNSPWCILVCYYVWPATPDGIQAFYWFHWLRNLKLSHAQQLILHSFQKFHKNDFKENDKYENCQFVLILVYRVNYILETRYIHSLYFCVFTKRLHFLWWTEVQTYVFSHINFILVSRILHEKESGLFVGIPNLNGNPTLASFVHSIYIPHILQQG